MWMVIASKLINFLGYPYESEDPLKVSVAYIIFYTCIFAPIWEEAVFRYAPITIAKVIGEKAVIPVIVISSCVFGWIHHYNPESVLLQGGIGFILSYVYLRTNSYASIVAVHALYNFFILILEFAENSLSLF